MIVLSDLLSCGHAVTDDCTCSEKSAPFNDNIKTALDTYRGRWRETLESNGVKLPPHKKNGPCPVCGGRDRFVFDDKDGRGTWHCRKCEITAGGGLLLLSRFLGVSTGEAAARLLVGFDGSQVITRANQKTQHAADLIAEKAAQDAAKKAAFIMQRTTKQRHPYLTARGLDTVVSVYKDLIAVPVFKNRAIINMQLIAADRKKTFLKGGRTAGGYNVIRGGKSIAICEGYATAITVNKITGCTTFCAFSAGNLFDISQKTRAAFTNEKITIFADRDLDCDRLGNGGAGLHYATIAAQAIGAKICAPSQVADWDDIRQAIGVDDCKKEMLKNLKTI